MRLCYAPHPPTEYNSTNHVNAVSAALHLHQVDGREHGEYFRFQLVARAKNGRGDRGKVSISMLLLTVYIPNTSRHGGDLKCVYHTQKRTGSSVDDSKHRGVRAIFVLLLLWWYLRGWFTFYFHPY